MQRLYFAGICGTFMGSLALIARELGFEVAGCDADVYPPMSDQLAAQGIVIDPGYDPRHLDPAPDLVIVGNALSRGNPLVESMLERGLDYRSGPEWLAREVLRGRHVLAVSGTHGKTTTSSLLAWILRDQGRQPGFLIGGVAPDLGVSGCVGAGPCFVIEADEYDSAFFDKRSKFVHYRPRTLLINNIEYDHADIFPDLAAIQRQFHHLLRTVPASGLVLHPAADRAVADTLALGCWSRTESFALEGPADWQAVTLSEDGRHFEIRRRGTTVGEVDWSLVGRHNVANGLAAVAAAHDVGVEPAAAAASLRRFSGVSRRLQRLGCAAGVTVYDDFAHHPTAIAAAIGALRRAGDGGRLLAVIEPRSASMRRGVHREHLPAAVRDADAVFWYQPASVDWNLAALAASCPVPAEMFSDIDAFVAQRVAQRRPGDRILIMSNGAFGDIHRRLLRALQALD